MGSSIRKTGKKTSRQEQKSSFYPILESLVRDVPGALGAIFSDVEGESIEFCGEMDPYDIKLMGAYSAVILSLFRTGRSGAPSEVVISCRMLTLCIRDMGRYVLTLVLERRTFSAGLEKALEVAARRFISEAGITG